MLIDVICKCGDVFTYDWVKPPRGGQRRRFCDKCVLERRKKWRNYQPITRAERDCTVCGAAFFPYKEKSTQSECSDAHREVARGRRRLESAHWTWDRLRRWGLTPDEYQGMLKRQGYSCAICGNHCENAGRLVIDHDHACCPGAIGCRSCIRGLLCGDCNRGLGFFRDNPFALRRAVDYVNPTTRQSLLTIVTVA